MSNDSNQFPQSGKWEKLVQPDSDSDESIVQSRRRKKASKFISEGETSDEESDVPRCIVRRQNHRVSTMEVSDSNSSNSDASKYEESSGASEWQSDWSSSSEVEKESPVRRKVLGKSRTKKPPKIVSETDTDSSDEQVEKCPICLLPFRRQELGTPSSCEHCFCLDCLIEWSKNINTCPVDRQTFTVIHVRDKLGGQVVRCVPVEVAPRIEENLDDLTFCEVCHHCDREDHMLLCDGCDCGYHLECLTPPLSEVPIEEWFCPECSQNSQSDAEAVEIDMDEISDLMEEARRLGVSYGRTRTILQDSHPRIVPRTRHTERVRAAIRRRNRLDDNAQLSRQLINDPNQPSTSSGFETLGDNSQSRSPSNASNSLGERYCSKKHPRKSRRSRNSSSESSDESISRKSRRRINDKTNSKRSDSSKSKRKRTTSKKSAGGTRKSRTRNNSTKTGRSRKSSSRGTVLREVRITERNANGEEEEIVTYVKVARVSAVGSRRRRTKRRKVF